MKGKFHIAVLCISTLFLLFGTGLSAQSGNHDPSIQLSIDHIDSSQVELSWQTPNDAISCFIRYETPFDTAFYPVTNLNLDSVIIPRSTPLSGLNEFRIVFDIQPTQSMAGQGGGSDVVYDDEATIMGGVVLISENVFYAMTKQELTIMGDRLGYFHLFRDRLCGNNSAIIQSDALQEIINDYESIYGEPDPGDHVAIKQWEDSIESTVFLHIGGPVYEDRLWRCNEAPPRLQEAVFRQLRLGSPSLAGNTAIRCFPNPFNKSLTLKSDDFQGQVKIIIRDVMGKQLYTHNVLFDESTRSHRIRTETWRPGLYIVQVIGENDKSAIKVTKP